MTRVNDEVVITGLGPVTSAGIGCGALWRSLEGGHTNVSRRTLRFDLGEELDLPIAGLPPPVALPGFEHHGSFLDEQGCGSARELGYALLAADLALADAGLDFDRTANNVGMIQVFEAPGVERTVGQLFGMLQRPLPSDGPPKVYDALAPAFYHMQSFLYVHLMSKALGLHGFCTSVHNACSSGAFAIETAARTIRSGQAEVMIVAGGEAFDTAVRLRWFEALGLYAAHERMRPFDADQSGFFVGEGGGAIVMESAGHAQARGATPYASYLGGAFAHQAWKQTIPDIRAARLVGVIGAALHESGISSGELDLIVPHGSATSLSDKYEASCLSVALGDTATRAVGSVFKPYVGHFLGASGLMDVIGALLSMRYGGVPGTLHARQDPLPTPMSLVTSFRQQPIGTVLLVSTGFTGHDTATIFRRN